MKNLIQTLILLAILVQSIHALTESHNRASLEIKEKWKFKNNTDSTWLPATVPGVVHLDLMANEIIEDPFWRDGETKVQWIEKADWEYETNFTVPNEVLNKKFIRIVFHGLDTHAYVSLNQKQIHESHSQFNRYYVQTDSSSLKGDLNLHIIFKSAPNWDSQKNGNMYLPGDNSHMWSRKAGYHYGWDWGPRLCVSGIWQPIVIEGYDSAIIEYAYAYLKSQIGAPIKVGLELEVSVGAPGSYSFQANIKGFKKSFSDSIEVTEAGNYTITHEMDFSEGELWWPNGYGKQSLYDIEFQLIKNNETIIDQKVTRTGFRKIELIQTPDARGKSFYFRVNNVDIYMKGANYIPPESFMNRMTKEKYVKYAQIAKESNYNMLRIWGGGQYEHDDFYEALDEYGIMIWHDFMFAGGLYPADEEYSEMMKIEFEQQVKRLRNHPSMAIYCGNNEIREGWDNWGWGGSPQRQKIWGWYETIFHKLIPDAVEAYDKSSVPYWPTSPLHGWGSEASMIEGDSHYWGIWHGGSAFEVMDTKVPRFMVEYGMQGILNIESIKKFTEEDDRKVSSQVMGIHQKHRSGWPIIQNYMNQYYRDPKDFESYVYVTQALQAKAFQTTIEAERRNKPYNMGTLYWQFNDCWPVTSWATLDYYYVWKGAQYRIKKYYEPIMVSSYLRNDEVEVYAVSDYPSYHVGIVNITLFDMDGNKLWSTKAGVGMHNAESQIIFKEKVNMLSNHGNKSTFLHVSLKSFRHHDLEDAGTEFEHFHYFVKPKDLELKEPNIKLSFNKSDGTIVLNAKNLVKDINLYVDGEVLELEENYFDVAPGEKQVKVKKSSLEKIGDLENKIRYISLWDSYNGPAGKPYK